MSTTTDPAPTALGRQTVTLRQYLAGHLLRKALKTLEDALNEPVKNILKKEFPNDGDSPEAAHYAAELQKHGEKEKDWKSNVMDAEEKVAAADEAVKAGSKKEKKDLKKAASKAKKSLSALVNNPPKPPIDVWLCKARSMLGDKMKGHVLSYKAWDTYTLVSVLCGFFDVFAQAFGIADGLEDSQNRLLLHRRLRRVCEARNLRAHGTMPTESEALGFLSNVSVILNLCGFPTQALAVGTFLERAQELKRAAYGALGKERHFEVSAEDQKALLIYCAIQDFEWRLEEEVGSFTYKDGTYTFGDGVDSWTPEDQKRVKEQKKDLTAVAAARHWLFHHTSGTDTSSTDGTDSNVFTKMGNILQALSGIAARNSSESVDCADEPRPDDSAPPHSSPAWAWTMPAQPPPKTIAVLLELSSAGMSIPVPLEKCLVGRAETIEQVKTCLSTEPARVLVHGLPGMGKDVVAAEVARSNELASMHLQLQAWLQGSTDAMLRQQLVDLFETQMPEVLTGEGNGEDERLAAIRRWLETHGGWFLVVEDAGWASAALWEYIPVNKGRLLVTSQAPLAEVSSTDRQTKEGARAEQRRQPLPAITAIELEGLRVSASLELLRKMVLFNQAAKDSPALQSFSSEMELQYVCAKANTDSEYIYAPDGETDHKRKARHELILGKLQGNGNKKALQKKIFQLRAAQLEYAELSLHPAVRRFLCEELGNVPLVVALCGQLLRSIGSVDGLIEKYRSMPLMQVDKDGSNPMVDCHYLGAVRSVLLLLRRIEASDDPQWPAARRLLHSLALLPSRTTPSSLFYSDNTRHSVIAIHKGSSPGTHESLAAAQPLFEKAAELLELFGLTREAEEGRAPAVHQLVQRIVREQPQDEEEAKVVLHHTREVLSQRITAAYHAGDYMDTRAVLPCAEWWCALAESEKRLSQPDEAEFCCRTAEQLLEQGNSSRTEHLLARLLHQLQKLPPGECEKHTRARIFATTYRARALGALGRHSEAEQMQKSVLQMLDRAYLPSDDPSRAIAMGDLAMSYAASGNHSEAAKLQRRVLELRRQTLGPRHPHTATAMNDLACSYEGLGLHNEAAAMRNNVLLHRREILPAEHPDLSMAMGNLGLSLIHLGEFAEAAKLLKDALELERRSLPPEHPRIGARMGNLAAAYLARGDYKRAAALSEETLELKRRILPPYHPDTVTAIGNLATAYGRLKRHEEAMRLQNEELQIRRRIMGPDHPHTAVAMNNLATTYAALGKHKRAAKMQEQVLELRHRILLPEDPLIGVSMINLGTSYGAMGMLEEAKDLHEVALDFLSRVLRNEQHPDIATAMHNLAGSYRSLGKRAAEASNLEEAKLWYKQAEDKAGAALRIRLRMLPPGHDYTATSHDLLRLVGLEVSALAQQPSSNADRLKAAKARARQKGRR